MKKILLSFVFMAALFDAVLAGAWVQNGEAWMYQDDDGEFVVNQVKKIDGVWYGFGTDGSMLTGYHEIDGKYYVFNNDGTPKTEPIVYNGKTYNVDGKGNIKGIDAVIFEELVDSAFALIANDNTKVSGVINHAKELLGLFPSKVGLRIALESEGTTTDLIEYAINNIGVNWKDQSVKAAMYWLEQFNLNRESLKSFLIIDGFTDTEANYGVEVAFDDGKVNSDAKKPAISSAEIKNAILAHYNAILKK